MKTLSWGDLKAYRLRAYLPPLRDSALTLSLSTYGKNRSCQCTGIAGVSMSISKMGASCLIGATLFFLEKKRLSIGAAEL